MKLIETAQDEIAHMLGNLLMTTVNQLYEIETLKKQREKLLAELQKAREGAEAEQK